MGTALRGQFPRTRRYRRRDDLYQGTCPKTVLASGARGLTARDHRYTRSNMRNEGKDAWDLGVYRIDYGGTLRSRHRAHERG